MVDKVALGQVSVRVRRLSPVYLSTKVATHLDTTLVRRISRGNRGTLQQRSYILDVVQLIMSSSAVLIMPSSRLPLALLSSASAFFLASAKRSLTAATEFTFASFCLALSRPKAFWIKPVLSWEEKVKVKKHEQSTDQMCFIFCIFRFNAMLVVAALLGRLQPESEEGRYHAFSDTCLSV